MTSAFPFGLPGATALYLCLYVITLALHVAFMSYVLAGSGYLAVRALITGDGADPIATTLRDWLPFGLGVAITAGVAPLLFLQILYKEQFYTANLLLFHRWMAIVPVLMLGFYLLYLGKSKRLQDWPRWTRTLVAGGTFACFVFVAVAFAENHMLALQDRSQWAAFYAEQRVFFMHEYTPVRLGLWLAGTLPIWATIIGWQHRADDAAPPRVLVLALAGIVAALGCGALYWQLLEQPARDAITGPFARPYVGALVVGLLGQAIAAVWQLRLGRFHTPALLLATAGAGLAIVGTVVIREALRLNTLGSAQLFALHERAAGAGGMPLFFVFAVVNGAVIAWCLVLTRRGLRNGT